MTRETWKSAAVALLFAVHPLNVESVAWIAERKSVLSTFLGMLVLLLYAEYVRQPRLRLYLALTAAFALGLMAKPVLVTLPCVLLLLDWWPLHRLTLDDAAALIRRSSSAEDRGAARTRLGRVLLEKAPLLALSCAVALTATASLRRHSFVVPTSVVPMGLRVANALVSYLRYLRQAVWPSGLAVFYPYPASVPIGVAVGAGIALLLLSVLVALQSRRRPFLAVGWLWYLGTLVPALGLKQAGLWPATADRFAYIPLIGLFVIVAWGLPELAHGWHVDARGLAAGTLAVVLALALCTHGQVGHWQDSRALFTHALAVAEAGNFVAHHNLADALLADGDVAGAAVHYRRALSICADRLRHARPRTGPEPAGKRHMTAYERFSLTARNNLGLALAAQHDFDGAIREYRAALDLHPGYAPTHNNLATALHAQGRPADALRHLQEAVRLDPGYTAARANLARALDASGRPDEAAAQYREILHIDPASAAAHNNLGVILARQGDLGAALPHFREAVRLDPADREAARNLQAAEEWAETAQGGSR
jgi:tetratricopeptide (TPR) repeat protein